jgi:hypothetical protein
METNTSESLIKCRKRRNVIKTRGESLTWDKSGRNLITGPDGDRHEGGVNITQALVRNVGTYDSDDNGKNPSGDPARMKVQMRSIGAD